MSLKKILVMAALSLSIGLPRGAEAAQETMGAWTLGMDDSGQIVSMSYPNPVTSKGDIQTLEFQVAGTAPPAGGTVTFKDGKRRTMGVQEARYYFERFEGPNAVWDYLASKNRVTKYSPQKKALPPGVAGKLARVVLDIGGRSYYGLISFDDNPGGFLLAPDGTSKPIRFENSVVSTVQMAQ